VRRDGQGVNNHAVDAAREAVQERGKGAQVGGNAVVAHHPL